MLKVDQLSVCVGHHPILKNLNLHVLHGEVHAIMGPNGSGKSTFFKVLAGQPEYEVTSGQVLYRKQEGLSPEDLLKKDSYNRAQEGLFMAFQNPIEVPGVSNSHFLRTAFNSICRSMGVEDMNEEDFLKFAIQRAKEWHISEEVLYRELNEGFSGGEKKKNELLQMAILSPSLSLLDEIDSGLDIDSIKIVSKGIQNMKKDKKSIILITHYPQLLDEVKPDKVHIFVDGQIKQTGDYFLAQEVNNKGYDQWI